MSIIFESRVNENVVRLFNSLIQDKEEADKVIEEFMTQYVSKFLQADKTLASNTMNAPTSEKFVKHNSVPEYLQVNTTYKGKANDRIPKWAIKSEQYNHKIIRAFFQIERQFGYVSLNELEKKCGDINYPETFVKKFRGNFDQMKVDNDHSHGKVFVVEMGNVLIWDFVKETLMEYKDYFCR